MNTIPRWSPSMSMRDPVLDARHIELLELCRTVQELVQHGRIKTELCLQRLSEISIVLREHDQLEVRKLRERGQRLSKEMHANRALAQQQLEELTAVASLHDLPQNKFHALLCGWIQYHLR